MKLMRTKPFLRAARRYVKHHPNERPALRTALERLAADPFDPRLATHKLTGPLEGSFAASVAYDLRIVFRLIHHSEHQDTSILLQTLGTHDQLY